MVGKRETGKSKKDMNSENYLEAGEENKKM
jgi:hypothetical protein